MFKVVLIIASIFITSGLFAQTSNVPISIQNFPENHVFKLSEKDTFQIVANGYYDTYIESSKHLIIKKIPGNNLEWEILPVEKGSCIIDIYGVSKSGKKGLLTRFRFLVE
jgi:hypothetical protein